MSNSFLVAFIRHVLGAIGGFLVAKGWFDDASYTALVDMSAQIAGYILLIGSVAWSYIHKRWVKNIVDEAANTPPLSEQAETLKKKAKPL